MCLTEKLFTHTVQTSALRDKNRKDPLTDSKFFFIWTTPDQGCQTPLPLQVLEYSKTGTGGSFQTDQGHVPFECVTHIEEDISGIRLLAHQYLITAVLNQQLTDGGIAYSQIIAKELKVLTGYQQALLRWCLLRHPEVQNVWLMERNDVWKLEFKFCFLKKEH